MAVKSNVSEKCSGGDASEILAFTYSCFLSFIKHGDNAIIFDRLYIKKAHPPYCQNEEMQGY